MAVLNDVKVLLDIPEDEVDLDKKLNILIDNAELRVLSRLASDEEEVPVVLQYIVTELVIARFNRFGNEGMSSYSQEGESMAFSSDDIAPYLDDIEEWNKKQQNNRRGVVRFL